MALLMFLFNFLLCFFCQKAVGFGILGSPAQMAMASPFVGTQPHSTAAHALLIVTTPGVEEEHSIEVPLWTRTEAVATLPRQLSTARIVAVVNEHRQAGPLKFLERIQCRVMSSIDAQEGTEEAANWFSLRDGLVQFNKRSSPYFVSAIGIKSYECK